MVNPQVFQFDMPDSGINPGGQFPIPDGGGVLHAPLGFQVNYIIAVACKGLAGIGGGSLFALLFKGCGESLSLFSCAFFCPCRGNIKGGGKGLELLPVCSTATKNPDGVGNQLAGLVPAFLNVSHYCPPFRLNKCLSCNSTKSHTSFSKAFISSSESLIDTPSCEIV